MERIFANTQHIGVKSLILGNVTSEGENVKVRATVEFEATEAKSGKSFQVYPSKNRVVILSKTANNWCIVRHISAERDLATALVKIKNDDERRQILKGNELFNINLAKAVRDEGDALDGKIPPGDLADIYRLGLSIAEQLNDTDEIIKDLNDLGLALADTDKNKALDVYSRAMKLAEETGNKDMAARVYNNVGVFYFDQNDFVRSLDYAQKSVALAEEIGEKSVLVSGLGLIGNVYSLRGATNGPWNFNKKRCLFEKR
jgi:tetratricopeptide (TPR) repeat protein